MESKQIGVDLISDALPFGRLWYDGPEAVANVRPIITVEAFEMADNTMPSHRYPPLQQYELGKNWLVGKGGRLP